MNRILVIRGGAIGDFLLTLPVLKALRDANPSSYLEILGYKHITELANNRFYANQVRSIEYGPLSSFFAKNSELPSELAEYFAAFDLIISYLYDPDGIFENNLRRCGVREIICGPAKIANRGHAARQLAEPMVKLGLKIDNFAARLHPSDDDRQLARDFLQDLRRPIVALHPGSGSEQKNWPIENWIELGNCLLTTDDSSRSGGFPAADLNKRRSGDRRSLVVIAGEADEAQAARLRRAWKDQSVRFAANLPLTLLAAVLENTIFIGHDSGISHLAAAAGANCILLFGPTDPEVWGPINEKVHVIRAPAGDLRALSVETVREAVLNVA
jgi:heptosyltransferase-2